MAIAEDIYARCRLCAAEAAAILAGMTNGNIMEPITVQARRTAADIAGDTAFSLLGRAFITPIDREDLWLIRESAERIWREAEDAALLLYHGGRRMPSCCEESVQAAAACCTAAEQMVEAFPDVDTETQRMRIIREAQRICHTTIRGGFADATARRVCDGALRVIAACENMIAVLRYAALKNG